jgi:hypothetical protein
MERGPLWSETRMQYGNRGGDGEARNYVHAKEFCFEQVSGGRRDWSSPCRSCSAHFTPRFFTVLYNTFHQINISNPSNHVKICAPGSERQRLDW